MKHTRAFLCRAGAPGSSLGLVPLLILVLVLVLVWFNLSLQQFQSLSQVITIPEKTVWFDSELIRNLRIFLSRLKARTDVKVICNGTELKQECYLTMHFQVDPSRSSCSSVYSRMFCSWSSWSQYIKPCRSRPTGSSLIFSGSSSLTTILNFRLSSNWHSQRYWGGDNKRVEGECKRSCCSDRRCHGLHVVILSGCLTCTPSTSPGTPSVPAPTPTYCSAPGKPTGQRNSGSHMVGVSCVGWAPSKERWTFPRSSRSSSP